LHADKSGLFTLNRSKIVAKTGSVSDLF
jgi:hypothetical protein